LLRWPEGGFNRPGNAGMYKRLFFRRQKPAVNDNLFEDPPVEAVRGGYSSVIAAGASVSGNIECGGDMLIEGTVRGSVRALKLTIGIDGLIEGDVSADEVTVKGSMKGPIHARHIHLTAGAAVEGDLTTTTIAIDTGAQLSGAVWQDNQDHTPGKRPETLGERYQPITASAWDTAAGPGSRSLLATRPKITGSR